MTAPDPNAASMRRLEADLVEALWHLRQARRMIDGEIELSTVRRYIVAEIDTFLAQHEAPAEWRRAPKATTQPPALYRGC